MSELANRSEHGFSRGSFLTVKPGCAVRDESGRVIFRAGHEVDPEHPLFKANPERFVWMNRRVYETVTGSKPKRKGKAK
ncbi:MAG: hypothetical protein JKY61_12360 [Planctomycetes bacterium]|nr:hypothetical protein [Planctomycetota bacterium]MBL4771901.1 hypothetical protein [Planctomycetota bacterium]